MKLVQLGCGITGLVCAEHLAKNPKVDELVLADMKTADAEKLVSRLRNEKTSVEKVDAGDQEAVRKLLEGADIVVSAVPAEVNKKVIRTAAAAGVDYVDYSLPVDSMAEFEELDKHLASSGITALSAMGADPGISDVFARYAADKLDSPETARVMDGDSGSAEGFDFFTLWSPLEMVEEVTVPAAVFKDGQFEYLPPLHERQIYEFPDPIGPLPVYNTLHEETFLMPANIKGLKYADFRIAVDDNFAQVANTLRRIGLHSLKPIEVKGCKVRPLDVVVELMPRTTELAGKVKGYAGVVVEVTGLKDGKKMMAKVWTTMSHEKAYELFKTNATGYLVGTGGAVGTELLIDGVVKEKGFLVPEQLPAEEVVKRLPPKHLQVGQEMVAL
jgi:saccharopine dehydrogenase (NAD+, L-lysine-forming)